MENNDRSNAIRERLEEMFELAVAQGLVEDEEVWRYLSYGAELMIWLDEIGQYFFDEVTAIECSAIEYDDRLMENVIELLRQIGAIEIDDDIYDKWGEIGYLTSGTFDALDDDSDEGSGSVDESREDGDREEVMENDDMYGHHFPDREEVIRELEERLTCLE